MDKSLPAPIKDDLICPVKVSYQESATPKFDAS